MINTNLKKLRLHHKLTQEEVALRINVSRQVVAKWEKGESTPDLGHSQALAKLYNVSLDNLVNFDGEDTNLIIPPKGKYFFGVAKIGDRGQIVVPKKARDVFQIKPGDALVILGDEDRGLAIVPEKMMYAFLNLVQTPFHKEDE
ncbi:helix-turn-helix domain-containing protein [Robertmurraya andreesenii]|uniref:AbrB family looped-hinge helix DNA binding protein n=1 Tax=Anoxybacillus andreesenii TaxID=1325932 RepID=A0ABT9UZX0_9BACL|nr:helix-turn-helix domain-containing protein [Robertmurraya andreesenii]MDQ0154238.1 AbrB family looped-hinge helix DNA binding protein [Robertmurraya andreesenii]